MFRRLAQTRGLLVLTDSDGAGMVIRNYLRGAIPPSQIKHAYIPEIFGKESRKRAPSKEGKLGVEGMKPDVLRMALARAGATVLDGTEGETPIRPPIKKADLYALGLSGRPGSEVRRKAVLHALQLPANLSANALIEFLNVVSDLEELTALVRKLEIEQK